MLNPKALSNLGIHVYGLAAIALALIGLVWGDFATVWQPVPPDVPHRKALAYIVAVCLLSAGAAMQWRRTVQAGVLVLATLYFMSALLWVPRVVGYPQMIGTWLGFAEQFALVVAGCLAYALLTPRNTLWAVRTAHIGRFLFGICVVVFGLAHFLALSETAGMVPKWLPPGQRFWALATGTAHLLAGIAILTGILAVLASRLLTAMLITFGVLVWALSLFAHPDTHMVWAGNAINLALTGAAWAVADSIRESAKASQKS
ncbi:MAG: DoxX family membrane protein [Terriglobales bacterium]